VPAGQNRFDLVEYVPRGEHVPAPDRTATNGYQTGAAIVLERQSGQKIFSSGHPALDAVTARGALEFSGRLIVVRRTMPSPRARPRRYATAWRQEVDDLKRATPRTMVLHSSGPHVAWLYREGEGAISVGSSLGAAPTRPGNAPPSRCRASLVLQEPSCPSASADKLLNSALPTRHTASEGIVEATTRRSSLPRKKRRAIVRCLEPSIPSSSAAGLSPGA